ncbi:hypothetical protein BT96DRAFT_73268 [Gymnopus androsaceus JB14]|uniref:F-box domain-containing protein n=1 Tax=Gymnopus androsaceus JB14 TaxID=1447944 RepID=A0A6A4HJ20_9AGAR|nr:hypothetical protein BT96DRAFT_73268 [Gymnopus androsaceus JB14]
MPKRKASAQKAEAINNEDSIPSAKRAKTQKSSSTTRRRGKGKNNKIVEEKPKKPDLRALLLDLAQAPLDIVIAIFQHLEPYDLLCLARSTKDIRRMLLSESNSHFIWEAARANVPGLPPKPDDMDEPAYANLMYDAHCHECLGLNCANVVWEWKMRLCRSCEKDLRIQSDELDFVPNPPFVTKEEFLELIPYHSMVDVKNVTYVRPAPRVNFWLESIVNDYLEEYEREVIDEVSALEWRTRLKAEKDVLNKQVKKCQRWHVRRLDERAYQRELLLKERRLE